MIRRTFGLGGLLAATLLVAFGAAAIVMGLQGRSTVHSSLKQEQLVGTPDMTPKAISAEARQAGLVGVDLPTCSVAGKAVTDGGSARCFAQYMRIHALESTGGKTYAALPSWVKAGGGFTNDKTQAAKTPTGQPQANPLRTNVWIPEIAMSTALNSSYMAAQIALFGIVMGIALVIVGLGLGILDLATLTGNERVRAVLGRFTARPRPTS